MVDSGMTPRAELGDRWPACEGDLTPEIRAGLRYTEGLYNEDGRARIENGMAVVEMADIFDDVDFVITASNPDIAFNAEGPLPDTFGGLVAGARNNGRLTFPPTSQEIRRSRYQQEALTDAQSGCRSSASITANNNSSTSDCGWSANVHGRFSHPSSDVMSEQLNMCGEVTEVSNNRVSFDISSHASCHV